MISKTDSSKKIFIEAVDIALIVSVLRITTQKLDLWNRSQISTGMAIFMDSNMNIIQMENFYARITILTTNRKGSNTIMTQTVNW